MSQPPYDYAQYSGQPAQHIYPYASTPHIQPTSSFYTSPQAPSPSTAAGKYATMNGSFEYNGSRIPGLGMSISSTTPLPSIPHRVESNPSQPQALYGGFSSPVTSRRSNHAMTGLQQGSATVMQPAEPSTVLPHSNDLSEEGEFSEGEFEDLYESKNVAAGPQDRSKQPSAAVPKGTSAGSADDADGSSIYDTGSGREEMAIDSTSTSQPPIDEDDYEPGEYEPVYQPRERTGSYSPRLSPHEPAPRKVASEVNESAHSVPSLPLSAAQVSVPGQTTKPNGGVSLTTNAPVQPTQSPAHGQATSVPTLPYKSVFEAKKKAQEAILGLWPLKVRYQNYIEEGLDPQIVNSLFKDLGLDTSVPKPTVALSDPSAHEVSTTASKQVETPASPKSASPVAAASKSHKDKPVGNNDSKTEVKKSAQEERKDKIARMLAEKKKKNAAKSTSATASTVTSNPPIVAETSPSSEPSDAAKVKLRAQNNQRILEKLAALKKQQVEKSKSVEQAAANTTVENSKIQDGVPNKTVLSATPVVLAPVSVEADVPTAPGGPAGLSVSSSPRSTPKPRNIKRPVASDFDQYPKNSSTFKRTRTQETLIIDVSDDEDVEMDLGSPTEPPPGAALPNNKFNQQNSLGAFPPLTQARHWQSQKSSPATPAAGTPTEHEQKLDLLTLQIQEARRKIAEAEAKKTAMKKPNGIATPSAQSPSRTPVTAESSGLPRPSESINVSKIERRNRIASYHLPVLDTAIREKQDRIERLQAEAAQAELELQATLNERQQLISEMEILETASPKSTEQDRQQEAATEKTTQQNRTDSAVGQATPNSSQSEPIIPGTSATNTGTDAHAASVSTDEAEALGDLMESSPEITNMEIDSDSSSTSGASNITVDASEAAVHVEHDSDRDVSQSKGLATADGSPRDTNEEGSGLNNRNAADSGKTSVDKIPAEADMPMQISDAEDEDSYEPTHVQISDVDPVRDAQIEDGEVPDEEPYEPSLTQAAEPVSQAEPASVTAEVQLRSAQEPQSLTTKQAVPRRTLSANDLLSYESPLRYFHAYKFHPQYMNHVAGGLKSMTYSSKIDATRPICPSLIDGGKCPNGSSCEFQHFDTMMRSDSDIIQELGSTDMYTGEQKDQFIDGLKKVLADLKTKKLRDFDSISKALVQYRSDFLGDKSKVLPLKDVVI